MSTLLMDVLRTLRVFGPMSNADIGRKIKMDCSKTYRAVQELVRKGYAVHPKLQQWDITENGRQLFDRMPNKPLTLVRD